MYGSKPGAGHALNWSVTDNLNAIEFLEPQNGTWDGELHTLIGLRVVILRVCSQCFWVASVFRCVLRLLNCRQIFTDYPMVDEQRGIGSHLVQAAGRIYYVLGGKPNQKNRLVHQAQRVIPREPSFWGCVWRRSQTVKGHETGFVGAERIGRERHLEQPDTVGGWDD
jgi:hypothetical protein